MGEPYLKKKSYLNKYILVTIFLAVIILAITLSFGSAKIETKHYENDEISFDYPANWEQTLGGESQLVAFNDPKTGMNVTVSRQAKPSGYKNPENFVPELIKQNKSEYEFVSSNNASLKENEGFENTYKINKNNTTTEYKELWVNTNGALYSIIFEYPHEEFNLWSLFKGSESTAAFDAVKNSLNITSRELEENPISGSIYIPSQGIRWDVRNDTINIANGVYRYPESFYPGESGTVGIMGHHTQFSAPFANINLLKVGDEVIIDDYLTQKRYVYEVYHNGDINWDYKVHPVQFPEGKSELTLVTCWPPGFMLAAWIVHCKLVSIEPLN
jgi:sortase A